MKISKWFDKGIDVKFPWELSRFYFAPSLALDYRTKGEIQSFAEFKRLANDWLKENPFCYGVNWNCTMEVAIRALNWIVAINIFCDMVYEDTKFSEAISISLIQHAHYISSFPEIYDNDHTTNHTTANYMGLLFLALVLKNHNKSSLWLDQAVVGLEKCIQYQTYADGINFEASIPYHRLGLEMFAYSAIVARSNGVTLSSQYHQLLFKMFEYSAAYVDHAGNAPQVGDNDSGRILIFEKFDEQDHSYLLDLGEHIFENGFKSQCIRRQSGISNYLPEISKIEISEFDFDPRKTNRSIAFHDGGAFMLKNDDISLFVSCFQVGQKGIGGHNHFDVGSYTLSINGKSIIVDPGTYTYTRDYATRETFKSSRYHNVVVIGQPPKIVPSGSIWGINRSEIVNVLEFSSNKIEILISDAHIKTEVKRTFLLNRDHICIIDQANSPFKSYFHLGTDIVPKIEGGQINLTSNIKLEIITGQKVRTEYYDYSDRYDSLIKSMVLVLDSDDELRSEVKVIRI